MEKEKAKEEMRNSRRQLKAMLRKNWLLKIRHPFVTCAEILLPTLVMLLLIAVRSKSDIRIHPAQPYIRKDMGMFVEVGKGDTSPPFNQVLKLLLAKEEYLAFAPNTAETRMMINILSLKFPLLRAVEVLREMEHNGLQPNVVTISTLLAACGRCCQKVNIDSILTAAKMRGIELNTVAYNSALGSYLNVGEYEKALALYKSMRKKKVMPDSVTYNVLISGCCRMSNFSEALEFLDEMMDLKIPLTKEVCSSAICAYTKQGQLAKAESMFSTMKTEAFRPDVIAYTTMLNAYSVGENWEKAFAVFQEMELNGVLPDAIACSALMRSFNRGCQPDKVLLVADFMRERNISFTEAVLFELVSASSILRDWRMITEIITTMEASLTYVSVGTLNQLLHSIGKSGKTETMIKFFFKLVTSGAEVNLTTYSVLLKNLLAAGNWRKYIEVLEWMDDGGLQPSSSMYDDILFFAQRSGGAENAAVIKQRVESLRKKSRHETTNELLLR